LCSDQIPDVHRIVACLRQNVPLLSGPCRAVFKSGAHTPQPLPPGERGRAVPPPDGVQPMPRAIPPQPYPMRPPPPQYDDDGF
jgi:hypothetical protein